MNVQSFALLEPPFIFLIRPAIHQPSSNMKLSMLPSLSASAASVSASRIDLYSKWDY